MIYFYTLHLKFYHSYLPTLLLCRSTPSSKDLDELGCHSETPRAPLHRIAKVRVLNPKLGAADAPISKEFRSPGRR